MDGKVIVKQKTAGTNQTETINLRNIANGKYIVHVVTGNDKTSKTIEVIK